MGLGLATSTSFVPTTKPPAPWTKSESPGLPEISSRTDRLSLDGTPIGRQLAQTTCAKSKGTASIAEDASEPMTTTIDAGYGAFRLLNWKSVRGWATTHTIEMEGAQVALKSTSSTTDGARKQRARGRSG